jgi:hypothetical protein
MRQLMDAWFELLDGNISVPVHKIDVPMEESGPYVWIYPESGTGQDNKRSKVDEVVIVVHVVTRFSAMINQEQVEEIDEAVEALAKPTATSTGLNVTGYQVHQVSRDGFNYITEQDGTDKIYSKVSRYVHRINKS